jgi:cytidyltransferase-like protein
MKKFVVMSGGFHPFHAGHASLYRQAKEAFPDATVLVCATNIQEERPFPFALKKKLAQLSGVPPKDFIEVSRQFTVQDPALANRIGDLNQAIVIYIRSDKDRNESPIPWKLNPDGSVPMTKGSKNHPPKPTSDYLLEYPGKGQPLDPVTKHAYMAYLRTVKFGGGLKSASEIRAEWPTLDNDGKLNRVISLYPMAQKNPKLAQNIVGMFDQVMGGQENINSNPSLAESICAYIAAIKPLIKEANPKQKNQLVKLLSEAKKKLVKNQTVIKENLDYLEEK